MALLSRRRRPFLAALAGLALALVALGDAGRAHSLVAQAPTQAQASTTDSVLEYRVKAAYLLNFTRYVEWPSEVHRSPSAPLVLCVYGTNPFGSLLDATVRGRKSQGHPIKLRRVNAKAAAAGCHLIFVSRAEWRRQPDLVPALAAPGVLTVGEGEPFAEAGGVIALVIEEQTVRFAVNLAAGEKAGLRLSSRMLALASRLYGEPKQAGEP
jgi:hypothetical protein